MSANSRPQQTTDIAEDNLVCMQLLSKEYIEAYGLPAGNNVLHRPDKGQPLWHLALQSSVKWPNGYTIRVKLLGAPPNPSDFVKSKVKQYAPMWSQWANIHFAFVETGDADIRVSFNRAGSWSTVGMECQNVPQNQPTMNFGWLDDSTSENEFQRVIVHEFGHAVGAIHEQLNPNVAIQWNKPAVYDYFAQPENGGWDHATTDLNMFTPVTRTDATVWDSQSIMEYKILPGWTMNGLTVGINQTASVLDQQFIGSMYPPSQEDQGFWNSLQTGKKLQLSYAMQIDYLSPYTAPPFPAVGLNYVDTVIQDPISVDAWTRGETTRGFEIHLDGGDMPLFAAGATWLKFLQDTPGVEVSMRGFSYGQPTNATQSFDIGFRNSYSAAPKVIVWLCGFGMQHRTWTLGADVINITTTGCTAYISALGADTQMLFAGLAWLAYPPNMADIDSGTVEVGKPGTGPNEQGLDNSKYQPFNRPFSTTPRVFFALSQLDFGTDRNMRINLFTDKISENGFQWHINSWGDTKLFGVKATWLAIK